MYSLASFGSHCIASYRKTLGCWRRERTVYSNSTAAFPLGSLANRIVLYARTCRAALIISMGHSGGKNVIRNPKRKVVPFRQTFELPSWLDQMDPLCHGIVLLLPMYHYIYHFLALWPPPSINIHTLSWPITAVTLSQENVRGIDIEVGCHSDT